MAVELTIKNYRCFSDNYPLRLALHKGFTGFVGPNNSGKSSILRFFYELRNLFQQLSTPGGTLPALQRELAFTPGSSVSDVNEIFSKGNSRPLEIQASFGDLEGGGGNLAGPRLLTITIPRGTDRWHARLHLTDGEIPADLVSSLVPNPDPNDTLLTGQGRRIADLAPLYETFGSLSRAMYIGSFRNVINTGTNDSYFDIRVGQAFVHQWRSLKTGIRRGDNEAIKSLERDIQHLFGLEALEINASEDNATLQIFVNGKSFRLPELGAGLTQFILVLASAAMAKPSYVLLDEPELSLHPSLQLDFLTTLAAHASEGVLFATHSFGLARASAEHTYTVRKTSEFESQLAPLGDTPRLSELLGELGFSAYKDLGFDRVLLVEGPKDVKTVQQLLRIYQKDHKIVLLPLSGSSLINGSSDTETQLQEIKRISDNVAALIDSERPAADAKPPPSREAFVALCTRVGVHCHVLERRAIENYFTDRAVNLWKGDKHSALAPHQKLKDQSPAWSKTENWRIAREMEKQELDETDLGTFLADL